MLAQHVCVDRTLSAATSIMRPMVGIGIAMMSPLLALVPVVLLTACSPFDAARGVYNAGSNASHLAVLIHHTKPFRKHWEQLNSKAVPVPPPVKESYIAAIQRDLQAEQTCLNRQFKALVASNADVAANLYNGRLPKPRIRIEESDDLYAYPQQGNDQVIVISSALLSSTVDRFGQMIFREKAAYRQAHGLSADAESTEMTEQIAIPRALEYEDSLIFILAHESAHLLVDPPLKEGQVSQAMEARADAIGLVLTGRCSFIVDIKQRISGVQNLYLIVKSNGGDQAYAAVDYARFGPELLFEIHQSEFEPGAAGLYKSVDERTSLAKAYMNSAVWKNVHTDWGTWFDFFLNGIKG